MKNLFSLTGIVLYFTMFIFLLTSQTWAQAPNSGGRIAQKVIAFKQNGSFSKETPVFSVASKNSIQNDLGKTVKRFTLLDVSAEDIMRTKPAFLNFTIPVEDGRSPIRVLLYKESISPNGFRLLTSDGKTYPAINIVHYRGSIDGDPNSVAAFSFSQNEVAGLVNNAAGNYVIGKLQDHSEKHIIYNDKDLVEKVVFDCGTNTAVPLNPGTYFRGTESAESLTTKCVNWYWETDYDLFVNKGSVANVNTYMQNVFNQVATLYANDGVSITLKTLYIWSTTDPYTGPGTSDYLTQFGVSRTSFDGDLATLLGTQGGGGIAWINGLCNSQNKYKMAYCGIGTSYAAVPTYSWTVECTTHEQGHLLGSRHTHDCAWNGNNTKIDGCGDNAGYPSGTCANPGNPAGGGTIMSYCHLTSVGINFNLGFGPQPKALIVNNVNNASCLSTCSTGCTTPAQPGAITGNASVCSGSAQTFSITEVSGATSYTWSLPSGWSGTSTTNSISVTAGSSGGNVSVTASNTCGTSTAQTKSITVLSTPVQPGTISGNTAVCSGTSQAYSITAVSGATSYTWTLPSGWSGTSTTNAINATSGAAGGTVSVKATNSCGSGTTRTLTVTITASTPAQPGSITGATTVCPGAVQTYSVSVVSGASSYNWSLPSGWSGSSTTNSISVTAGSVAGNISVTASNGCGTSAARMLAVNAGGSLPAAPGTITVSGGAAKVCTGDSRTYTVSQVAGLSYNWVAPTGATITSGQGTNSIVILFTSAFVSPSNLTVTATNSCGTGPSSTLTITKNTITRPGAITVSGGTPKVCNGDVRTYTVPSVAGMTYNWVAPAGGNITGGQGTASITVSYNANFTANGTLSVTANNQCGTSSLRNLTIARNTPGSPAAISGPATICPGTTATYTATAVASATSYIWTIPAGATIQGPSGGNTVNILWGANGGTLAVRSANACGNSGSRSLKIIIGCPRARLAQVTTQPNNSTAGVYPNPTSGIANVSFYSQQAAGYTLTVTDIAGRKLLTEKLQATSGMNIRKLNLAKFTGGTYLILIEGNNTKEILKVNVQ